MATEIRKVTQLSWRRHLATPEGIEGMLFLRENTPTVQKGSGEEIIFEAGVVEGYRRAIDKISEVIASAPKTEVNPSND